FDTARPLEGAGVSNYSRGQVEETFAFSVEKDHSSLEESREYCFDHAITLAGTATDILQVEVPDGKIYRLSAAVIMDWSRQVVPKVGVHRTRWTYRIGGGVWSEH